MDWPAPVLCGIISDEIAGLPEKPNRSKDKEKV